MAGVAVWRIILSPMRLEVKRKKKKTSSEEGLRSTGWWCLEIYSFETYKNSLQQSSHAAAQATSLESGLALYPLL